MKKIITISAAVSLLPSLALAQQPVTDAASLFDKLSNLGNMAIFLLIGFAVVYIVWNTFQFIRHAASDDRKTYQAAILWGVVGLFVIMSIWGLVAIVSNTFFGTGNASHAPNYSQDVHSLILQ